MAQVLFPGFRATDANGAILAGALLYVYEAGTTTPLDVYTDAALTTAEANPVVCDAGGLLPVIYGGPDDYKFVIKTSGGSTVQTIDNFTLIDPATATAVASTTITSDTNVAAEDLDRLFNIDASSGDVTLTADSATLGSGFRFGVRLASSSNSGIIQPGGGQTINGASSFTLDTQYDSASFVSNGAGGWDILAQTIDTATLVSDNAIQKIQVALGAGRFEYSSATVCKLMPFDGNYICFPSGDSIAIGASGISTTYNSAVVNGTAAQTLAASTLHYAYVYNNAGTLVIDWSTTAPAWDATTGIRIKTSDATRVLVGMAYANGSSQFDDAATKRNVASWRNRRPRQMYNAFTTTRTTTTGTYSELNTEIRLQFITWGETAVSAHYAGVISNSGSNSNFSSVAIDSTSSPTFSTQTNGTNGENASCGGSFLPSLGLHYITLLGATNGGTASWLITSGFGKLSGLVTI